jgi:hypothetical protein
LSSGAELPSWLTFENSNLTFWGTPLNVDVGVVTVRVNATDDSGAFVTDDFTVTITNLNDAPVVANPLANQTATEDSAFSFTVPNNTFDDVDANESLSLTASLDNGSPLPNWLEFNTTSHEFKGTPTAEATLKINVTATDSGNATVNATLNITVGAAQSGSSGGNNGGGGGGGASATQGSGTAESPIETTIESGTPTTFTANNVLVTLTTPEGTAPLTATFYELSDTKTSGFTVNGYGFDLDIEGLEAGAEAFVALVIPTDQAPEGESFELLHMGPGGIELVEATFEVTTEGIIVTFDAGQLDSFSPFMVTAATPATFDAVNEEHDTPFMSLIFLLSALAACVAFVRRQH